MSAWNGFCQRCYQETNGYTRSLLNTRLICIECSKQYTVADWLNKKVERSPYYLAVLGAVIIALTISSIIWLIRAGNSSSMNWLEHLHAGDSSPLFILLSAIIVVSPLVEELLFRKFLWWVFSILIPPEITLLITSVLFAAIHGNFAHAISILPISFFLGWLRLKTGSIKPCIVAHMVNNAAASVFMFV
jgi:membrane protease YdiL (CAAX protease family)